MSLLVTALILLAVGSAGFVLMRQSLSHRTLHALIALWAGVMISVSLLHILPEASEIDHRAFILFGLGFTLMYLLENVIVVHTCVEVDAHCHYHQLSIVASIALLVHTLFDGIAIAAAESLGGAIGIAVLTGVAIHQIPTSLSLASLLKSSHLPRVRQALILALFAISAPLGYLGGRVFLTSETTLLPLIVAFAGGTLMYVGASDLLPSVHREEKYRFLTITSVILGGLLWVAAMMVEGH